MAGLLDLLKGEPQGLLGLLSGSPAREAVTPLNLLNQETPARMSAHDPSFRDRMGNVIYDAASNLGMGSQANRMRAEATSALDFIPLIGQGLALDDIKRAGEAGDWGGMALAAGGIIPGAGPLGKKLARGFADIDYFGQTVRILQNPSPQQTAGFLNRTKYKAARRIHNPATGETYLWDAGDPALHKLMAEQLGMADIEGLIMDVIGLD